MTAQLSGEEQRFVDVRRRLMRPLRRTMLAAILLLMGVWGYEIVSAPLLANPWHAVAQLSADGVSPATLRVMAGLTPLLFNTTLFLTLVLLVFALLWSRREQTYLALIARLQQET